MKPILKSTDLAMLIERSALLESRGIPTHREDGPYCGAIPSHLYVVLDEHLEDARALLEDADHRVANPVFPEDLESMAAEHREAQRESADDWMLKLVMGFFLCVAAAATVRTLVLQP
jgi:hypothetical protein